MAASRGWRLKLMSTTKGFIVVFDDGQGLCCPMAWSKDPGKQDTLEGSAVSAAVFPSRSEARKAVNITSAQAKVDELRGKPVNSDFLSPAVSFVKIIPLKDR